MNEDDWDKAFSNPASASVTPAASAGTTVANPAATPPVAGSQINATAAANGKRFCCTAYARPCHC